MLVGEKVVLRAMDRGDAPLLLQWMNDLALRELQCNPLLPVTAAMVERMVAQSGSSVHQIDFGVIDRQDNMLVGFINLSDLDWISRHGQLGIIIGDRQRHGRGLGGEAITLLIDYAFHTLSLHRIWLRVLARNARAMQLYDRLGFQQEGVLKDHVYRWGGYHDVLLMAKINPSPPLRS